MVQVALGSHHRQLAIGVFSEVEVSESHLFLLLVGPPTNLGMVVHLLVVVFVGPFVILGLPLDDRLAILLDAFVLIVSESQSMIVETSELDHTEESGL